MLLAIDTSTGYTGVACLDAGQVLAECVWQSRRDHTAQLLPQIDLLLAHLGVRPQDLTALAVALGPGSWSGLRVGMSVAKGIALARGLPLVGVGTLDVLASQHAAPGQTVCALVKLGRERFGAAIYPPHTPSGSVAPQNVTFAEIATLLDAPALFVGDLDDQDRAALRARVPGARFPAVADAVRRPGYVAVLGWERLHLHGPDSIAALEPIYLGLPVQPAGATK